MTLRLRSSRPDTTEALITDVMQQKQHTASPRPERFHQREWKLNKPHLPKSNSLPVFRLLPIDRPIFACEQCGFINTNIPLCFWCCWTSEAAHRMFEDSMPRGRRASAPPRIFREHNSNLIPRQAHACLAHSHQILTTHTVDKPDINIASVSFKSDTMITNKERAKSTPSRDLTYVGCLEQTINKDSILGNVVNATCPGDRSFLPEKLGRSKSDNQVGKRARKSLSRHTSIHFPLFRHSEFVGVDRRSPMKLKRAISTKSLLPTPIKIDLNGLDEPSNHFGCKYDAPAPRPPISPGKTLKRKKRISTFHSSDLASSRPQSVISSIRSLNHIPVEAFVPAKAPIRPSSNPNPTILHRKRSRSLPASTVRLGHHTRPYYTAIRPATRHDSPTHSFKRPSSSSGTSPIPSSSRPSSLSPPFRAPSPGIFSVLSSASAVSDEDGLSIDGFSQRPRSTSINEIRPLNPLAFGPSFHFPGGFSLSGETELRMALASQAADGPDPYSFKDMKKRRGSSRVIEKVKGFKNSLKELVMGKPYQ